ncbi:MAG: DinB family protein [Bacteroidales bacterium]|nr:DinB family protein [Bacteroidales bacterium]
MTDLLGRIATESYAKPLQLFNGSSIGQHFRHIVDFYGCLNRGLLEGRVDYSLRQRDPRVETEPVYAAEILSAYFEQMKTADEAADVEVVADFSSELNETRPVVLSTVGREMMYAYDHAVHHLAMIKMGLKATSPTLEVDKNLGVAPSTVKHWNA